MQNNSQSNSNLSAEVESVSFNHSQSTEDLVEIENRELTKSTKLSSSFDYSTTKIENPGKKRRTLSSPQKKITNNSDIVDEEIATIDKNLEIKNLLDIQKSNKKEIEQLKEEINRRSLRIQEKHMTLLDERRKCHQTLEKAKELILSATLRFDAVMEQKNRSVEATDAINRDKKKADELIQKQQSGDPPRSNFKSDQT